MKETPDTVPPAAAETESVKRHAEPGEPAPACPKCGAAMVRHQMVKGAYAGQWFWACSAFPRCREVQVIG